MSRLQTLFVCCMILLTGFVASCDIEDQHQALVINELQGEVDRLSAENNKFRQMFNVISPEQKCITGDCVEDDLNPEFRKPGPEHAWYIKTFEGSIIKTFQFINAVVMCELTEDPTWLLTFSSYKVDVDDPTQNFWVIGAGGSAIVSQKTVDCWFGEWQKNGAIQIQ